MTVPKGIDMVLPKRKHTRLPGYSYSTEGYYYVTICTQDRQKLFWNFHGINEFGLLAEKELLGLSGHYENVKIDKYTIMPDHIHCIVVIGCGERAERSRPFPTLSNIIGLYKSGVSREMRKISPNIQVWQKSFHDHIIRDKNDYIEIWQYIDENPILRTATMDTMAASTIRKNVGEQG